MMTIPSQKAIVDALEKSPVAMCFDKEWLDETDFGPNEFLLATDRKHRMIQMAIPGTDASEIKLIDAILFEERTA